MELRELADQANGVPPGKADRLNLILLEVKKQTSNEKVLAFFTQLLAKGDNLDGRDEVGSRRECLDVVLEADGELHGELRSLGGRGVAQDLLSRGEEEDEGMTALMWATLLRWESVVRALIEHGCDAGLTANHKMTPLMIAALRPNAASLFELLANSKSEDYLDQLNGSKDSALMVAVKENIIENCRCLINLGASQVIGRGFFQKSCLNQAIEDGSTELALLLTETEPDVNEAPKNWLPLVKAAEKQNVEVVQRLLEKGADPKKANRMGKNALMEAAVRDSEDITRLLLRSGGDPRLAVAEEEEQWAGYTALHFAAEYGSTRVIPPLKDAGGDVNAKDEAGSKPIEVAYAFGRLQAAALLTTGECEPGFLVGAVTTKSAEAVEQVIESGKCEQSTLDVGVIEASKVGSPDVMRVLLAHGGDPNATAEDRGEHLPAVTMAAMGGHLGAVMQLARCETRLDLTRRDPNGCTALHYIIASDPDTELLDYLLEKNLCNMRQFTEPDKNGVSAIQYASNEDTLRRLLQLDEAHRPRWMTHHEHKAAPLSHTGAASERVSDRVLVQAALKFPSIGEQILDTQIQPVGYGPHDSSLEVHVNFKLLKKEMGNKKNDNEDYLETLLDSESKILDHPVTKLLLRKKYERFPRFMYMIQVVIYFLLAAAFSTCALKEQTEWENGVGARVALAVTLTTLVISLVIEAGQVRKLGSGYFLQFFNLFQLIVFLMAIVACVNFCFKISEEVEVVNGFMVLSSVTTLGLFLNLLLSLRRAEMFGIYITIFCNVLQNIIRLAVPILVLMGAFTCAFYPLFRSSSHEYQDTYKTMFKLLAMAIGSVEPSETGEEDEQVGVLIGRVIVFVVFVVFVTIITINLLTGIAINDVNEEMQRAKWTSLTLMAEFVVQAEALARMLGLYRRFCFDGNSCVVHINQRKHRSFVQEFRRALRQALVSSSQFKESRDIEHQLNAIVNHVYVSSKK